jgi:hypothetical protein
MSKGEKKDVNNEIDDGDVDDDNGMVETRRTKLVLNDISSARVARLRQVTRDYLPHTLIPYVDVINVDATTSTSGCFGLVTLSAIGNIHHNSKSGGKKKHSVGFRAHNKSKGSGKESLQQPQHQQQQEGVYDRILVDAPCSSDRHVLQRFFFFFFFFFFKFWGGFFFFSNFGCYSFYIVVLIITIAVLKIYACGH